MLTRNPSEYLRETKLDIHKSKFITDIFIFTLF